MATTPVSASKTPWHLWVIGVLSLLWNLLGAFAFFITVSKNAAYLQATPPAQIAYFNSLPAWVMAVWGIATWGAALGSLVLLLRLRVAVGVFLVSLVAMVTLTVHNYGFTDIRQVYPGPGQMIFTAIIFVVCVLLWLYARTMARRGVLR